MDIAIVHDRVRDSDAPDAKDVLHQAGAVGHALRNLGHRVEKFACTTDLEKLRIQLKDRDFRAVFNLVESLDGQGRLIHLLPCFLDGIRMPYTGASADAILATSNKVIAKNIMAAAGLPTPPWIGPFPAGPGCRAAEESAGPGSWIVKSVWEHASIGLDASGFLIDPTPKELLSTLNRKSAGKGGACFAERFIEGREFNLSILAGPDGPEVLPPAEIIFEGYDSETPRIVDYSAKWDETSYAFHHTPRTFDFQKDDRELIRTLRQLAKACWRLFGLGGYARVDFRVDNQGAPWILEVNTNPCLSPDAGFAAALERGNMSFDDAIERILDDMLLTTRC